MCSLFLLPSPHVSLLAAVAHTHTHYLKKKRTLSRHYTARISLFVSRSKHTMWSVNENSFRWDDPTASLNMVLTAHRMLRGTYYWRLRLSLFYQQPAFVCLAACWQAPLLLSSILHHRKTGISLSLSLFRCYIIPLSFFHPPFISSYSSSCIYIYINSSPVWTIKMSTAQALVKKYIDISIDHFLSLLCLYAFFFLAPFRF